MNAVYIDCRLLLICRCLPDLFERDQRHELEIRTALEFLESYGGNDHRLAEYLVSAFWPEAECFQNFRLMVEMLRIDDNEANALPVSRRITS